MSDWTAKLTIICGYGTDRETVVVGKNVRARDRAGALSAITAWAEELGLGDFMARDDCRVSASIGLGASTGGMAV